jgi:dTDP-4-dehydrorhamnose 3,5-epimerase
MFISVPTAIPGCYEIRPHVFTDHRGKFVKTFHRGLFAGYGLNVDWREEYYSVSKAGVLRGLHFQLPPHDHEKLVYCTAGEVLDVVVDLRVGSPTFGQHLTINLSAESSNMVYIPCGLAHGFLSLSVSSTLMYKVASVYSPENDAGILWSSVGVDWPVNSPILSDRDSGFLPWEEFHSPFLFDLELKL